MYLLWHFGDFRLLQSMVLDSRTGLLFWSGDMTS